MIPSKEYPGFYIVEHMFNVNDIVDWYRFDEYQCTCIITEVCNLADHEDNYEASYYINELKNGRMTEESIAGGAYESELRLNKTMMRERELEKLLGRKPSNRMTEDE